MEHGRRTTPIEYINENAPVDVLKNTVASAGAGAAMGGTYGVMYGRPGVTVPMAMQTGANFAVAGFCYFGTCAKVAATDTSPAAREYLVLPYTKTFKPEWISERHFYNLFPSAASGAILGLFGASWTKRRIGSGMLTAALVCCGLQAAANELSIISGYSPRPKTGETQATAARELPKGREGVLAGGEGNASAPHGSAALAAPREAEPKTGTSTKILQYLKEHSPIQPLSNDEYKQRLEARDADVEKELSAIDTQLQIRRAQLESKSA